MSVNRENVIWQSPDGTWNRGFFDHYDVGDTSDPDWDHEWDVEYDHSRFKWVSTGHRTEQDALRSWDGANPGGHSSYGAYADLSPESRGWVDEYEDMAAVQYETALADANRNRGRQGGLYSAGTWTPVSTPGYWGYSGPPKTRTLAALQRERNQHVANWVDARQRGYDNQMTETAQALNKRITERLATCTPEERAAYEAADTEHRAGLRQRVADIEARRIADAQRNNRYGFQPMTEAARREAHKRAEYRKEVGEYLDTLDADAAARVTRPVEAEPAVEPAPTAPPSPKTARKAPAKKPAAKQAAAPPARAKTTAKSTAGSFATQQRTEASGITLESPAPTDDDLWAPLPGD